MLRTSNYTRTNLDLCEPLPFAHVLRMTPRQVLQLGQSLLVLGAGCHEARVIKLLQTRTHQNDFIQADGQFELRWGSCSTADRGAARRTTAASCDAWAH